MAQVEAPDTNELRKARGAFFTPPEIARYVVDWALRSSSDKVLEPSCGEASFLIEAGRALRKMGNADLFLSDQLNGIEIHAASAAQAKTILASSGFDARILVSDFFECKAKPQYDAVVGNPPYVRYQQHAGAARLKSLEAALGEAETVKAVWKPQNTVALDESKAGSMMKLIEVLEDDDDVQDVYANFEIADAVLAKLTAA